MNDADLVQTRDVDQHKILQWMHSQLDIDPRAGTIVWRIPPRNHAGLRGMMAGTPTPTHIRKIYWLIQHDGRKFKRSWLIFLWVHGRWPTDCLDHIDGNSENDAISNLREATVTQNAWNHKGRARRTEVSLPMGLRLTASGRFQARIGYRKSLIHLGTFRTEEKAVAIYLAKRKELFGEFA